MTEQPSLSLLSHFRDLQDPRVERTRDHLLLDLIAIAICAVIGGADDWVAIETFTRAKYDWFARFLALPNGIPSHDTFGRVFARLAPTRLAECFQSWMATLCQRCCWVFGEPTWIRDRSLWVDLRSVVVVVRRRDVDGKSSELHYYISSRPAKAADFLQATRGHWRIENNCHWVLDVSFAEDQSRIRKDHGAENFAWLRRMALSLLKRAKGVKGDARCRRLKAGWGTTFLEQVLSGFDEE